VLRLVVWRSAVWRSLVLRSLVMVQHGHQRFWNVGSAKTPYSSRTGTHSMQHKADPGRRVPRVRLLRLRRWGITDPLFPSDDGAPASMHRTDTVAPHEHLTRMAPLSSQRQCDDGGYLATARLVVRSTAEAVPAAPRDYSYDDWTVVGWVIAGSVKIGCSVAMEYVSGYALSSVTGIPALCRSAFGNSWQAARLASMTGKSAGWAKSGAVSLAAYCMVDAFRVGVRVGRKGKKDEWTTLLSTGSLAAGAFFC
jgi:hypothetical protein